LFKPYKENVLIGDSSALSKHWNYEDIFCVGLQTKEQADMMMKFGGKIICGDATHGLTSYDYQMFSLVVKDDLGKGYPVAHLVTSNADKLILTVFFQAIKTRNANVEIRFSMSDDDAATKGAFKAAFGPELITLLCHWHVPLAWKRNISLVPDPSQRDEILYLLGLTLTEKEEAEFNKIINVLMNNFPGCDQFLTYFSLNYLNRPEEWAGYLRNFFHDGVETNMLLESLHNYIKTVLLKRHPNRRVDTLIELLLTMEQEFYVRYTVEKSKNNLLPPLPAGVNGCHKRGLNFPDSSVYMVGS